MVYPLIDYYLVINRSEILIHAAVWTILENITIKPKKPVTKVTKGYRLNNSMYMTFPH